MGSRVQEALTRKLGPLPAWAWAVLAFGVVFFYRRMKGQQDSISPISPRGEIQSDDRTPRDPVVLQPGESVYDPESGQLLGGGGAASPGSDNPPPPDSGTTPPPADGGGGGERKTKPPLRTAKKTKHPQRPRKPAPHPQHRVAKKKRSVGAIRAKLRGKPKRGATKAGAHPARPHKSVKPRKMNHGAAAPKAPERSRAPMPRQAALRQRPAPPRGVNHASQTVVKHPATHATPPPATHPVKHSAKLKTTKKRK